MARSAIRVAILTSSRADFGIYLPLLTKIKSDSDFTMAIIAFGSHLSRFHGYTVDIIRANGLKVDHLLDTIMAGDAPESISTSMSITMAKFAHFWACHATAFDVVFCLGDRYEMFAAVAAGVPFGVHFAHIHGGETTLGATDNFFRHSISQGAWCHFVATAQSEARLAKMLDSPHRVFNVGSLGVENLQNFSTISREELTQKFGVAFDKPIVLTTYHPETVDFSRNEVNALELVQAIRARPSFNFVVSMPNSDTSSSKVREVLVMNLGACDYVKFIENFGTQGYLSMMQHSAMVLGNTSSGIIEAPSFGRYFINVGDRQKGRVQSNNVINVPNNAKAIIEAIDLTFKKGSYKGPNVYYQDGTSGKIIEALKSLFS